ncbi:Uncharacterized protein TPAR_03537 [Tolypocladium paradoxum]|uniref:Zn(2)-C6 fungal-type domain-containing protein n=1 Tax=Tolypocladium paradoxum TaxID=94208 RepID=A0A2S4L1K7_9HYPO|nr:Uncharacterized protein TPAR_03537 [Tolypocladium paradoxum]
MSPKKRATGDADLPRGPDEQASASKRQRVSLACDGCRAAREKCDGGRPQCGTCVSQNRACSYTPASKKRGVQTGYLRTIELSLAWLFDQVPASEEALSRLLTQNGGSEATNVLVNKGKAATRLHRKWTKSRVQKEIGRLLSEGRTQATEASAEDSDPGGDFDQEPGALLTQDQSTGASGPNTGATETWSPSSYMPRDGPAQHGLLRLPSNWQRLIEVYFSYTHCWFPILERDAILATAASYDSYGTLRHPPAGTAVHSRHAELWAALAVASFQDAHSSGPPSDSTSVPERIFRIARGFVPQEDGEFDIAIINAILLHSIVLVGRQSELAASLLVGKASRLLLHLASTETSSTVESTSTRTRPILAACIMLDAVTSLSLGQAPHLRDIFDDTASFTVTTEHAGSSEGWSPVYGFGPPTSNTTLSGRPKVQPCLTLEQLSRFAQIMSTNTDTKLRRASSGWQVGPEDLVRCLSPQFSFCNSLISGGSTPMLPGAYLVKIMFLAATVKVMPDHRASLLSNFLEVVESSVANFGACGTPPLVIGLLRMVQKHASLDEMHASERTRWNSTLSMLRDTWAAHSGDRDGTDVSSVAFPEQAVQGGSFPIESFTRNLLSPGMHDKEGIPGDQGITPGYGLFPAATGQPGGNQSQAYVQLISSPVAPVRSMSMSFQPTSMEARQPAAALHAADALNQPIDYDAILEELGTIDYTDSIEMDPQFMMNLGFAPGCDLGEMFHGDFGI